MKVFVIVDMEGISGICVRGQVLNGDARYAAGRKYLTWDVNACVEGCFAGGVESVVVQDAHGGGHHFLWEELDPRAEYIQGATGKERMPDIGSFDGLILLGYHAMAGTPEAILEHTMSSANWQNFWLNGRKTGEIGIDAAIAGERGVPAIMASGDDKACREAEEFIPGIVTACVKTGLSVQGGRLLSAETAHKLITACATEAVQKAEQIAPVKIEPPVTARLEVVSRGRLPVRGEKPYVRIIDGRTYEVTADSVQQALDRL
ncbi:MAG: M55 family metallopeptidase [Candidatus Brocadiae bacterium]|nr:M55 family metallopeptidase [Candidatus Brocadiia bacterium]